jgi:sortase B
MKNACVMKNALWRVLRDVLTVTVLMGLLFGAAGLWDERRQSGASDFEMPTLPGAQEDSTEPGDVDFAGLRRAAPETAAWLTVPGTEINYPVAQWTDNQYYLKHTVRHEDSRYGAIFMDYRNHSDFSDFYTIIYGHNMRSGKMFGTLREFRDPEFFERVKTGTLRTPEGTYQLQFFSFALADSTGGYYNHLAFVIPGEKEAFIEMLKRTAGHWREIPLGPGDRIVALSTCLASTGDKRILLLAKLVEQS